MGSSQSVEAQPKPKKSVARVKNEKKNSSKSKWTSFKFNAAYELSATVAAGKEESQTSSDGTRSEGCKENIHKINAYLPGLIESTKKNLNNVESFNIFLQSFDAALQTINTEHGIGALAELGAKLAKELEAQTGLDAPRKFAHQVRKFIEQEVNKYEGRQDRHYFFLFHPDTDWHPEFYDWAREHELPDNFLGMSQSLDALCTWMIFLRRTIKGGSTAQFHLLVPAYQPLVIREPLTIPHQLFPLTVSGHVRSSTPYVWMRLPLFDALGPGDVELEGIGELRAPAREERSWGDFIRPIATGASIGSTVGPQGFVAGAIGGVFAALAATPPVADEPAPRVLGGDVEPARQNVQKSESLDRDADDIHISPTSRHVHRGRDNRRPGDRESSHHRGHRHQQHGGGHRRR